MVDALGIVETIGFTAAVQAADAAVKSANVRLGKWVKVGGGRVGIVIRGDVAAVKAAVDAGGQAGRAIGNVQAEIVIPRPAEKLVPKFKLDAIVPAKEMTK